MGALTGSFTTAAQMLSGAVGPGVYTIGVTASNNCGTSRVAGPVTVVVP
jgi:hypothetical protein